MGGEEDSGPEPDASLCRRAILGRAGQCPAGGVSCQVPAPCSLSAAVRELPRLPERRSVRLLTFSGGEKRRPIPPNQENNPNQNVCVRFFLFFFFK